MTIKIDPGLRIDDRFAARLVGGLLEELRDSQMGSSFFVKGGKTPGGGEIGNPGAQRKTHDRIIKANARFLLSAGLTTGKRMKFRVSYEYWTTTSANANDPRVGPLAWLVGVRTMIEGNGPHRPLTRTNAEMVAISRHALERLVQRGGISTSEDLIWLIKAAWWGLSLFLEAYMTDEDIMVRDGETAYIMPVRTRAGVEVFLAVIRNPDKGPMLQIVTVLPEKAIVNQAALGPFRAILHEVAAAGEISNELGNEQRLRDAVALTAKASRRGRAVDALKNIDLKSPKFFLENDDA